MQRINERLRDFNHNVVLVDGLRLSALKQWLKWVHGSDQCCVNCLWLCSRPVDSKKWLVHLTCIEWQRQQLATRLVYAGCVTSGWQTVLIPHSTKDLKLHWQNLIFFFKRSQKRHCVSILSLLKYLVLKINQLKLYYTIKLANFYLLFLIDFPFSWQEISHG